MFDQIKSSYILKDIFSFVNEKKKLELVKYSKNMQNRLEINIIHYKFFSGKYKIADKNGKGKEYNGSKDIIIFEGEYLNGKRHGKGKEYGYDDSYFIGEYLNGKRHGKGKEYYFDNNLNFVGEYLNDKRHGKGKEYDFLGFLKFEGEYFNGKIIKGKGYDRYKSIIYEINNKNGYMKEFYDNGKLKFEGEFINGDINGKGKEYYKNGSIKFEGKYFYNKQWNGKGYDNNGNTIYELNNGKGFIKKYDYIFNALEFEGDYLFGSINGKAKEYNYKGILIFEGEYVNGYKQGLGKEYDFSNGRLVFEGEYLYNKKEKENNMIAMVI